MSPLDDPDEPEVPEPLEPDAPDEPDELDDTAAGPGRSSLHADAAANAVTTSAMAETTEECLRIMASLIWLAAVVHADRGHGRRNRADGVHLDEDPDPQL